MTKGQFDPQFLIRYENNTRNTINERCAPGEVKAFITDLINRGVSADTIRVFKPVPWVFAVEVDHVEQEQSLPVA